MDELYENIISKGFNPINDYLEIKEEYNIDVFEVLEQWKQETFNSNISVEDLKNSFSILFDFYDTSITEELKKIVEKYNIPIEILEKSLILDGGTCGCLDTEDEIKDFIETIK